MRYCCLIFFSLFVCFQSSAENTYDVSAIPKELLPRASAVIRYMDSDIDVKSLNHVTYKFKKAVTVLNQNGDGDATIYIWYNKNFQVKSVKGRIYNDSGKEIAKISEKNFSDRSAASNSSLFEDSRIKVFQPRLSIYPYTVEFEYEIRSNQTLNFPSWYPMGSTNVAVEHATLRFTSNPDFKIRYNETNYPGEVVIQDDGKSKTYHWEIKGLKALRDEPYSPLPETFLTSVKVAPDNFSYQGIKGSFTNWDEYGKWMYEALLKGRNEIPKPTADHIKSLTENIADPREKAKKIYEYMQQKTRYVSIQIGIGGFQPFLASEVDRTSYGDCKALVNYTQGLLNVVGIKSHYVVVTAGDTKSDAIPDFASMNQFNHAILSIPFDNDTVWVDCTSKNNPFGYLGTFTDDRLAVACTEDGGKLIRTPKFEAITSQQVRNAAFILDGRGAIKGKMKTIFNGWQYDNRDFIVGEPLTEQLKKIPEIYRFANIDVQSFNLIQDKGVNPTTVETMDFNAEGYGALNSDLMFVPLNRVNQSPRPNEVRDRENVLYINRGYVDIDSIEFEIPENFKVESLPNKVFQQYPFGTFEMKVEVQQDKILYSRHVMIRQGTFPAEQYADLVQFYRTVADADAERFILRKDTSQTL